MEKKLDLDFCTLIFSDEDSYITTEKKLLVKAYNFNKEFQKNFIEDYLRLVEMGFDGVYVDVEPIRNGEDYLKFLDEVRKEFSFVGVYSGAVGSHSDNEWEWDLDFYKEVCNKVDLIFVPGYDSDLSNKKEYLDYIEMEVRELSNLNLDCDLMLGVPTHKSGVENLENALQAYSGVDGNRFIGVGVFAEWTMDKKDWAVFERYL